MDSILKVVPYGENIAGGISPAHVVKVLEGLLKRLEAESLTWSDVSLLIVADSTVSDSDRHQHDACNDVTAGIAQFSSEQGWSPPMIGSSVFGSFFSTRGIQEPEIKDGLLFVACISSVVRKVPVAFEITRNDPERRYAGERVLKQAVQAFRDRMNDALGLDIPPLTVAESSIGLIFTTGSGHIEAQEEIDFKECYAVGQDLLAAAKELGIQLFGGCATNRSEPQLQCLYYSQEIGPLTHYMSTFRHGAVMAFLPYTRAQPHLRHPYRRLKQDKLEIAWHKRERYDEGRNFYIRTVNGKQPIEFLAGYWDYSVDELEKMADDHTPIPSKPRAHLVTIASSGNRYDDENIWPNVPVWLDREGDETLLRLVRAEADDSNFYLMELRPEYLADNARDLMTSLATNFNSEAALFSFLCESRKYVLDSIGSNGEAEAMLAEAPQDGALVGIYLNGEYSTGADRSIGYHNYSQISAIMPQRPFNSLPVEVAERVRAARATNDVKIFMCHSKVDSATVAYFGDVLEQELPGAVVWIDERELLVGDDLRARLREAIKVGNHYFAVFLSDRSVDSDWVKREMSWAVQQEREGDRTLILPIVLGDRAGVLDRLRSSWKKKHVKHLDARVQLTIHEYTRDEIATRAKKLAADLKKMIKRDPPGDDPPMTTLGPRPGA